MSSNFLQWDPSTTNADNDATYLADTVRISGGAVGGLLPSPTFNKFAYQNSTAVTALMAMLASKGYTVSDASLSALTSVLQNILTNADVRTNGVVVPYLPNPIFNATNYTRFEITLTGDVASSTLVNVQFGDLIVILVGQDSVGGHQFVWPTNCYGVTDVAQNASVVSSQLFYVESDLKARALAPLVTS